MLKKFGLTLPSALLIISIGLYILYFSLFSIRRYQKYYTHYFDLGIMHQTVYNTYKGLQTGDVTRILEMTDPHESTRQVKRMAVHNDILLAAMAPFYFIHEGPETLLVIQTVVLAVGAYFLFHIGQRVFHKQKHGDWIALAYAVSYLLYPPMQKANNFDFHAVTLATTFFLAMYYFYREKRYILSFICALLILTSKEQAGLIVAFFGGFILYTHHIVTVAQLKQALRSVSPIKKIGHVFRKKFETEESVQFASALIVAGVVWVVLSMAVIIPYFRGGAHFGTDYYSYLFTDPWQGIIAIFRYETLHYLFILMAPIGLLSLLSPAYLLIAIPEFAVNILSSQGSMRNIYFHYDSLLTPVLFIAAMYGGKYIISTFKIQISTVSKKYLTSVSPEVVLISYLLIVSVLFSLYLSPLPWGHHRDIFPWRPVGAKYEDVSLWQQYLDRDEIKVSTTGHLAAHFTSRRYFYNFAEGYDAADYIVIDRWEITEGFQRVQKEEQYSLLQIDHEYIKIYDRNGIEVYRKLSEINN